MLARAISTPKKWMDHCKMLDTIYKFHKNKIPCDMIKSGWPGSGDPWADGDDLMWVDFRFHFNDKSSKLVSFDPNYSPVPIQAFPMLMEMAKDQFTDASDAHMSSDTPRMPRIQITKDQVIEVQRMIPVAMMWNDFGKDDNLTIHCFPVTMFQEIMGFDKKFLKKIIKNWPGNDRLSTMYVGEFTFGSVRFKKFNTVDSLIGYVQSNISEGMVPIFLQAVRDDENESEIIFWMADPDAVYERQE